MALIISRHRLILDFSDSKTQLSEEMIELLGNARLNSFFLILARELDVIEPKSPDDIYKNQLDSLKMNLHVQFDSAKANLSAVFVNGFLNAGFGSDEMFQFYGNKYIFKNKDHGMLSATASLGLIKLWDVYTGLTTIDKYLYSSNEFIKAGALLACGILNCGVTTDVDPAHAILSAYLFKRNHILRISSIFGLGIAYTGTNNAIVLKSLRETAERTSYDVELYCILAMSIGLIAVGTCNSEDVELLFQMTLAFTNNKVKSPYLKLAFLALGLLYLGCQGQCEVLIETLKVLDEPYYNLATVIVEMCAYAGTGNVLKVQRFLHICSEHSDNIKSTTNMNATKSPKKDDIDYKKYYFNEMQSIAVIGVALIALGDDIGSEMAFRSFGHLIRYGEPCIRRAVPLAIAFTCISNPKQNVIDMLNKFSHDNDAQVAYSAIFSMGLLGAGTNHTRLALLLRQLAQLYVKASNHLFIVRIAQGLVHLGKGTMTLNPYHSDRKIMRPASVAALLNLLFVALHIKDLILEYDHYLFYLITPAIEPRCLITFDENLNQLQVPVRVGIAVDVVAQAGKPKTITGFQTNSTPILLNVGERAELATDDYISMSPVLEGFVILRKTSVNMEEN